jgi:glyoxylase-like metal-dependent hydrolase (beta-lactamase superfamily II)
VAENLFNLKVHVIQTGSMFLHQGFFSKEWGRDIGKKNHYPVWEAVITGGPETIIFDTGIGDISTFSEQWKKQVEPFGFKSISTAEFIARLKEIGLKPEDIDIVFNSHLHVDHAGFGKLFKHAKFCVQRGEIRYAYAPNPFHAGAYSREHFDFPGVDWMPIVGDYEIFDGINALTTPGHTPYHQSLTVNTKEGTVILTGDCCYNREEWEDLVHPGSAFTPSIEVAIDSIRKLKRVKNSIPLFNHDMEFFTKEMKKTYG